MVEDGGKTMTNQASGLHELCKKVYELTGWERDNYNYGGKAEKYEHRYGLGAIYTSDYLLEKLPKRKDLIETKDGWLAMWAYPGLTDGNLRPVPTGNSDTPLKALLKLTIALSEAGELE